VRQRSFSSLPKRNQLPSPTRQRCLLPKNIIEIAVIVSNLVKDALRVVSLIEHGFNPIFFPFQPKSDRVHRPFARSSTPRSTSSSSLSSTTTTEARDLCVASHPYRGVQDFFVRIGCVQLNRGVKAMMDTVRIRQATLEDLPLLLRYRRAMAEEMDGADEAAVNG
jgi:hypothetical protein